MAVYIVSAARTPIGSILGSLSTLTYTNLGSHAVKAALARAKPLKLDHIEEIYFGNVLSAGIGQAPARQVSKEAGLGENVVATTVNKVCASGLKSITLAAQSIQLGSAKAAVAGGAESMSNVPHYLHGVRKGIKYGKTVVTDGIEQDGLTDAYDQVAMGLAGEDCAKEFQVSRAEQDAFATQSYTRAQKAIENGDFVEIEPVEIAVGGRSGKGKQPKVVSQDEEANRFDPGRVPTSRAAFKSDGTITAVNASKLSDGGAAVVLAGQELVDELQLKPLAKILAFTDVEVAPIKFPSAPAAAIKKLLNLPAAQGISLNDVDFFELNEAFSVVGVANAKLLGIDSAKVNIWGGAVALGHPLGCSGARIVTTLTSVLKKRKGKYGVAAICNGGGGASAVLIENLYSE